MKLLFKQRFFSWLDSYDIFYEDGTTAFSVEGQLSWGHRLHILDSCGTHVGTVQEKVLTFLPRFELSDQNGMMGTLQKEFTFFRPRFNLDFNGWTVDGQVMEWDYTIRDAAGGVVATVTKELFNWTDTYVMDIVLPEDALYVLMIVLAIDAEKCSRG